MHSWPWGHLCPIKLCWWQKQGYNSDSSYTIFRSFRPTTGSMPLYLLEGPEINNRPFGIMTLSRKEGVPIVSSLDMWVAAHPKALEPENIPLAFHVPFFPFWPTPNWWENRTEQSKCSKERIRACELFGGLLWTLWWWSVHSLHMGAHIRDTHVFYPVDVFHGRFLGLAQGYSMVPSWIHRPVRK